MKIKSSPLRKLLLIIAGVLALAALPLARAVPTLKITDGVSTLTISDTTGLDINQTAGVVTYYGGLGSFFVNITTGTSSGDLLTLDSVDISGAAGTLTIYLSDDSFAPTSADVTASIYGTTPAGGSISYSVYAGTSLFDTSTSLTTGLYSGTSYSGTTVGALTAPTKFSLTQKVVITHAGYGVTDFYASAKVPDGGVTVALLGFALIGLEGLRRKSRGALEMA